MYRQVTACRACGFGKPTLPSGIKAEENNDRLIPVLDLGVQPLANDFRKDGEEHAGFAPLKVMFCPRCTQSQLSVVVDPDVLYSNYSYVTSQSDTMHRHFESLFRELCAENKVICSVLEIGSNDGRFLTFLRKRGVETILGIDPALNLAAIAGRGGIPTIGEKFDRYAAGTALRMIKHPDVIVARHVFCHTNDWKEFIHSLGLLAGKDTVIFIEVPHVSDMLAGTEFDTIYHEHLSYLSVRSLSYLLNGTGLSIHRVIHFPIHGGAIGIMIKRGEPSPENSKALAEFLSHEEVNLDVWGDFANKTRKNIMAMSEKVRLLRSQGRTVCGYGASAKSTVWVNACRFSKQHLSFICDNTPQKQLCFSPGTDIPIADEGALTRELPDYCILFAWNFASEIIQKERVFLKHGGKFILATGDLAEVGEEALKESLALQPAQA